ncbi:ABC transporter ATP-binding protein [Thermococcus gammatolerans]|uniref:Iron(III) dicitrate ABC transporter, ATP-binding protein (FecE) n=1 Tax=Thermococcus gammatolerans (strain DSM 15229 / JCM 11827 / EJ3) TaxID=593117 RepID=C5A2D6_THEGJ|nr:ABC transporter ATP-binding protein [Thermococcus gammatolerans]ACS34555.1 Iron(III) dicitrate ABC transporter, ATP-binding protein (fecE) [Thermococcus gammatolerans EJ3]
MILRVNVSFSYGKRKVLKGVSFEARRGSLLAIIGPNGAGKSTLLKCIAGILRPDGKVELDGVDLLHMNPRERARFVSYVPQASVPEFNFTIEEFVEMGTYFTEGSVRNALRKVGLWDRRKDSVLSLSGGEYQLVLLARALAQGGRVILLDEPTSHLDVNHALRIMELLRELREEKVVIAVLHDLNLALRYANELLILKGGEKVWEGSVGALSPKILEEVYGVKVEFVRGRFGTAVLSSL